MGHSGSGSGARAASSPGAQPDHGAVGGPGPPPAPQEHRERATWARAAGATITLLIAVLGAVTGTAAWLDARRIDLRVSPAPYPASTEPLPIEVALVNRSQRGVALVGGHVLMDGERVGRVDVVVPDPPLDWRARPLVELSERARPLPITLEPSQSMTVAFNWAATSERAGERIRRQLDVKPDPASNSSKPRIPVPVRFELELQFDPGGTRIARIGVVRPREAPGPADLAVLARLRRGRVVALLASGREAAIGVLRVWSEHSTAPVLTVSRPVAQHEQAAFPLELRPGRYSWSLTVAGKTLVGSLRTPCKPSFDPRRAPYVRVEECQPI